MRTLNLATQQIAVESKMLLAAQEAVLYRNEAVHRCESVVEGCILLLSGQRTCKFRAKALSQDWAGVCQEPALCDLEKAYKIKSNS